LFYNCPFFFFSLVPKRCGHKYAIHITFLSLPSRFFPVFAGFFFHCFFFQDGIFFFRYIFSIIFFVFFFLFFILSPPFFPVCSPPPFFSPPFALRFLHDRSFATTLLPSNPFHAIIKILRTPLFRFPFFFFPQCFFPLFPPKLPCSVHRFRPPLVGLGPFTSVLVLSNHFFVLSTRPHPHFFPPSNLSTFFSLRFPLLILSFYFLPFVLPAPRVPPPPLLERFPPFQPTLSPPPWGVFFCQFFLSPFPLVVSSLTGSLFFFLSYPLPPLTPPFPSHPPPSFSSSVLSPTINSVLFHSSFVGFGYPDVVFSLRPPLPLVLSSP